MTTKLYHPFIIGNKIYLRGIEKSDITGNWFNWFNDPAVTRYGSRGLKPVYIEDNEKFYNEISESEHNVTFAIINKDNNEHIGNISLQKIDWINRICELGITIGEKKEWGKGYGTEATILTIRHGFDKLNLRKIYLCVISEHTAAVKLYKEVGFITEGTLIKEILRDNKEFDYYRMAIFRDDFYKKYKNLVNDNP